jgi:hypothetical protein
MTALEALLNEIESYQSNHYGYYDRQGLVNAYNALSGEIKSALMPTKKTLSLLWRGCDGFNEKPCVSFTTNKEYAETFGHFLVPFDRLESHRGLIDTNKLLRLANKFKVHTDIGDDEGEVIVVLPSWKPS